LAAKTPKKTPTEQLAINTAQEVVSLLKKLHFSRKMAATTFLIFEQLFHTSENAVDVASFSKQGLSALFTLRHELRLSQPHLEHHRSIQANNTTTSSAVYA
jgi:hypothetical protein